MSAPLGEPLSLAARPSGNRWGTLPVPDTFDQPGLNDKASAAAALTAAPQALALVGVVPVALWRRKKHSATDGR
ncbi:hypothetical protein SGLAM104S_06190 [Streptomyces glaucescens]